MYTTFNDIREKFLRSFKWQVLYTPSSYIFMPPHVLKKVCQGEMSEIWWSDVVNVRIPIYVYYFI